MKIELESIGTIHTQFTEIEGMPIQPTGAKGIKGKIEIKEKYRSEEHTSELQSPG